MQAKMSDSNSPKVHISKSTKAQSCTDLYLPPLMFVCEVKEAEFRGLGGGNCSCSPLVFQ